MQCSYLKSQVIYLPLKNGSFIKYHHQYIAFGTKETLNKNQLCLYKFDSKLIKLDSLSFDLAKPAKDAYLAFSADTLHDFLNIYVQEKNSKVVSIYRFDKQLTLKAEIKSIDVARINNSSVIGKTTYVDKHTVYAIKSAVDSSGNQFYLNKYRLKSETENFDYHLIWQYPFEKKHIHSASILKADSVVLYVSVSIYEGAKAGDWLLKVNSKTGQLIKALKLIDKNENAYLMPGCLYSNPIEKTTWFFGQKLNRNQFDPNQPYLATNQASVANMYVIGIDSLGAILSKNEIKIPISDQQQGPKKTNSSYFITYKKVERLGSGKLRIECDIYKNEQAGNCFFYSNTQQLLLSYDGEQYQIEKTLFAPNLEIENYYHSRDKLNMNGKICIDSIRDLPQMYRQDPNSVVKMAYKTDEQLNGTWILTKSELNKQQFNVSTYGISNKIYQLKSLENIPLTFNPKITICSQQSMVVSFQAEETIFQLKFISW